MKSINYLGLVMAFLTIALFSCGEEEIQPTSKSKFDTEHQSDVPAECSISGSNDAERNSTGNYTMTTELIYPFYNWSIVSGDISIVSGSSSSTVSLSFGPNFSGGIIECEAIGELNSCAERFVIDEMVTCTPPSISIYQVKEFCPGENFNFWGITSDNSEDGYYDWTVSSGAAILSGQGTKYLRVESYPESGRFSVSLVHTSTTCPNYPTSTMKYADFRADCEGGPFY
ncbi:hypothetical protein AB9P05_20000 [Roseivirga sp. BDSF3-8]|uniref:hypothetical protein n=1 Tax=Roseivirga sp. BDSF3-8 TaxID=3241598 RepID=UPI003531D493